MRSRSVCHVPSCLGFICFYYIVSLSSGLAVFHSLDSVQSDPRLHVYIPESWPPTRPLSRVTILPMPLPAQVRFTTI